jgi:flagellar biosynthesis/type III secretory pathway chaperone
MEHKHAQREEIIGGIDKLAQEIIKLKNNLTEILDYIDLKRRETNEQANQQLNLIESSSKEIEELKRILEEKKRILSELKALQERYLRFTHSLSIMEQPVLDEYQQVLNNISKNLLTTMNLEHIAPSYRKKLIDEHLSNEKISF